MRVLDVVTAPWAIYPDRLTEIAAIYMTHLRGDYIDLRAVEARIGKPLNNERIAVEVVDGVAVVPVQGVLARRMNLFQQVSGGSSYELIENDVRDALDSTEVSAIVLDVDSPGGAVAGAQELSQLIAGAQKPVVAWGSGMMASAAYWVGSAADAVYVSGDTTQVGSIGVVATHVDTSDAERAQGVRVTELTAGRYKRAASSHAPLSPEGRAVIQEQLDEIYGAFVDDVAQYRGTDVDDVLDRMADGRVFLGQRAIDAGLVDGVSTREALIERLAAGDVPQGGAGVAPDAAFTTGHETMDEAQIRDLYPEIVAAIESAARASERERILGVEAQTIPGHEALIDTMRRDGETTPAEAACAVVAAENARREEYGASTRADAPEPLPPLADEASSLSPEERARRDWDSDAELQAEFGHKFDRYLTLVRRESDGGRIIN